LTSVKLDAPASAGEEVASKAAMIASLFMRWTIYPSTLVGNEKPALVRRR
jgi:hypothetical protein